MKTERDAILKEISTDIAGRVPCESIVLTGSRATRQETQASDYDIMVVMNTFLIPFYLKRLRKIGVKWQQKLGVDVVINPLPTFRAHRAKGNLFLFKVRKEAITICGKNHLEIIDPVDIEDIDADWYFSYLCSAMIFLNRNFSPKFVRNKPSVEEGNKLALDAAKAMFFCGEVYLLMNRCYETRAEDMVSRFASLDLPFFQRSQITSDLELALKIKQGSFEQIKDPLAFWFRVKKYIIDTYLELIRNYLGIISQDIVELAIRYLEKRGGNKLKNLQYLVYVLIVRRELFWRCIISKHSVEARIRIVNLLLLRATNEDGNIAKSLLEECCNILRGYTNISKAEFLTDDVVLWKYLRDVIITYSTFACTVMGL